MMTVRVEIGRDGYATLKLPRIPRVIKELKRRLPVDDRWWDPDAKRWLIAPESVTEACTLLREFFDDVEIEHAYPLPDRHPNRWAGRGSSALDGADEWST